MTHQAQIDLRPIDEIKKEVIEFFKQFDRNEFSPEQILNMDETATCFDMPRDQTIDFVGAQSINTAHSGHQKERFTTCLTIVANGLMLTPYILFSKLKKPPNKDKCPNEFNLFINVCESGFMNEDLIIDYIDKVVEPYSQMIGKKLLLIWDQHESHKTPLVKNYLRSLGHKFLYVPARGTDYLQPLDVSINKPFKSHMRDNWDEWFENAEEVTRGGNLKRASYGEVVNWVHYASKSISSEIIKKSFFVCGLTFPRDIYRFNLRLCEILGEEKRQLSYKEDVDWDRDDEMLKAALENEEELEVLFFADNFDFILPVNDL